MDKPIRIPRHLTALMQHMQRLVTAGHHFWTTDRIPVGKLPGFINKWQPGFRLRADAPARAYRRRTGKASVHLCIHPDALAADKPVAEWWMLSTAREGGVAGDYSAAGQGARLSHAGWTPALPGTELLEQPKTFRDKRGKVKTVTTWTWRLAPSRYREWEALLVERAKAHDRAGIEQLFDCLRAMPMFAGVRSQVIRLAQETNKMLGKVGGAPFELPTLPVIRMLKLWSEEKEL